ncbi:MAG: hypothetical protein ACFFBP_10925 [Promethearchaeota archaeon]
MAKDKIIGAIVIIVGILIGVIYTLGSIVDLWLEIFVDPQGFYIPFIPLDIFDWKLFVVAPIWLIVVLIAVIAIWIGYSMLTTPAPVPLEELEEELAAEESA